MLAYIDAKSKNPPLKMGQYPYDREFSDSWEFFHYLNRTIAARHTPQDATAADAAGRAAAHAVVMQATGIEVATLELNADSALSRETDKRHPDADPGWYGFADPMGPISLAAPECPQWAFAFGASAFAVIAGEALLNSDADPDPEHWGWHIASLVAANSVAQDADSPEAINFTEMVWLQESLAREMMNTARVALRLNRDAHEVLKQRLLNKPRRGCDSRKVWGPAIQNPLRKVEPVPLPRTEIAIINGMAELVKENLPDFRVPQADLDLLLAERDLREAQMELRYKERLAARSR